MAFLRRKCLFPLPCAPWIGTHRYLQGPLPIAPAHDAFLNRVLAQNVQDTLPTMGSVETLQLLFIY